jgi:hypothetical protein
VTNTIIDPGAVMVHKNDAPIAIIAVKNVWRLQRLADRARFFQQGVDWVIPLFLM